MQEERRFRPFDTPDTLMGFLRDARLLVAGSADVFVEAGEQRTITESELAAGNFSLELARTDAGFEELMAAFVNAPAAWDPPAMMGVVVVAYSRYLKLAEVLNIVPMADLERVTTLGGDSSAKPFQAPHHGCDLSVYIALLEERPRRSFEPWRKGTWLARTSFDLRTAIDGIGYALLPLTDEVRAEHRLLSGTLRYIHVPLSPLEVDAGSAGDVVVYLDTDLLVRLERESSRPWAIAFTDQLVLDFLTAVIFKAVSSSQFTDAVWGEVSGSLLGDVMGLVARTSNEVILETHLDLLRDSPNKYISMIEDSIGMRKNAKRLWGD
jgi:hypothetical protein